MPNLNPVPDSNKNLKLQLKKIKEDAAKTPFDVAGLTQANQLLISTGLSADDSRETILALGNAISATGGGNEELSRMAVNLQQIKNTGKAAAIDIKQATSLLGEITGKDASIDVVNRIFENRTSYERSKIR